MRFAWFHVLAMLKMFVKFIEFIGTNAATGKQIKNKTPLFHTLLIKKLRLLDLMHIFTVHNSICGKIMFSQASVSHSVRGGGWVSLVSDPF